MMRTLPSIVILLTVACKGEPTALDVEPVEFAARGPAIAATITLPESTILAHDGFQALNAVVGLMAADIDVQQMLNVTPNPLEGVCWTTSITGATRSMSYDLCGTAVSGVATLEDTALGPKVITTNASFSFGGFGIGGGLGLTEVEADSPIHATAPKTPTGEDAESFTVRLDNEEVMFTMDGHLAVDSTANIVTSWGTATATSAEGSTSFVYGGTVPSDVDTDTTPAEVHVAPTLAACRCSTNGQITYDTVLTFDSITLDLAGALVNAGTLWPDLVIDSGLEVPGLLVVEPGADCGTWTGTFVTTETIALTGDQLRAGVALACGNNSFNDAAACERARLGAASVDALPLDFSDRTWREAVEALTDNLFDNGSCPLE